MSGSGLGRVKTPTFNLPVEIPSRFRKFENQKCLRPLLREDDRENNSAHSWLVHVFTQPGSKAEVGRPNRDFRFTPKSRHQADGAGCPFCANSRSNRPYSMTSSARASSDGGIERPSNLAVRMFSTNSNFTGCSIGRSEALAPCRILDTWLAARR